MKKKYFATHLPLTDTLRTVTPSIAALILNLSPQTPNIFYGFAIILGRLNCPVISYKFLSPVIMCGVIKGQSRFFNRIGCPTKNPTTIGISMSPGSPFLYEPCYLFQAAQNNRRPILNHHCCFNEGFINLWNPPPLVRLLTTVEISGFRRMVTKPSSLMVGFTLSFKPTSTNRTSSLVMALSPV